jgi:ABC-type transport system involved in multi-copper enzyme maturation permease subunit
VNTPTPDGEEEGVPDPYEVWFKGPDGVLTGVAFGLVPVVLPFLPVLAASHILRRDKERGLFQLSLTKPIPPWGLALGKFVGLYGALAIPTVAISLGSVLTIQSVSGASLDTGFMSAYVTANILLVGLYLLLVLLVGSLLPEFVSPLVVLAWVGFNLLRQTAYFIAARLGAILGADVATTFQVAWTDLATFTGLYQGILAPSVPASLDFVIATGSPGSLDLVTQAIPWAILAWFLALFVVYALVLRRIPRR